MRRGRRFVVVAALLTWVGALGCAPQEVQLATAAGPQDEEPGPHELGWIEGRITAGAGEPAGRTVQVMRSQPAVMVEGTSDAEGRFRVPGPKARPPPRSRAKSR